MDEKQRIRVLHQNEELLVFINPQMLQWTASGRTVEKLGQRTELSPTCRPLSETNSGHGGNRGVAEKD